MRGMMISYLWASRRIMHSIDTAGQTPGAQCGSVVRDAVGAVKQALQ
jgi:hypothetical protein